MFRLCSTALALALATPALAQTGEGPYKGQQLRIVISAGVGGGYDAYARLLARHLDKYVAGRPAIVLQNMPGAAGMLATNWAYSVAPKDGSVLLATYNALTHLSASNGMSLVTRVWKVVASELAGSKAIL